MLIASGLGIAPAIPAELLSTHRDGRPSCYLVSGRLTNTRRAAVVIEHLGHWWLRRRS